MELTRTTMVRFGGANFCRSLTSRESENRIKNIPRDAIFVEVFYLYESEDAYSDRPIRAHQEDRLYRVLYGKKMCPIEEPPYVMTAQGKVPYEEGDIVIPVSLPEPEEKQRLAVVVV